MTAVGEVRGLHIHEAKPLVGAFRSDTLALLDFMYLLGDRLHGELVDRRL